MTHFFRTERMVSLRLLPLLLCCFLCAAAPAFAQSVDAPAKSGDVPFRADAGLITAEYYLSTGKYTQAIQVLGGVLTRHPQNADAYTYRGYAYAQLGDVKKARENYNKAISLDPAHLGANKYLADIYLAEGDQPRAMEQLQAMRLICAESDCAEIDELMSDINRSRRKQAAEDGAK